MGKSFLKYLAKSINFKLDEKIIEKTYLIPSKKIIISKTTPVHYERNKRWKEIIPKKNFNLLFTSIFDKVLKNISAGIKYQVSSLQKNFSDSEKCQKRYLDQIKNNEKLETKNVK